MSYPKTTNQEARAFVEILQEALREHRSGETIDQVYLLQEAIGIISDLVDRLEGVT